MRQFVWFVLFLFTTKANGVSKSMINFLTYEDAKLRGESIDNVSYKLHVNLTEKNTEYDGNISIEFLAKKAENIFLDFSSKEGKIKQLSINGKKSTYRFEDSKVHLSAENMKVGEVNTIEVVFKSHHSKNGKGFYRFEGDKEVFVCSNLEPYYANEMFPHFDQPDKKAEYELTVKAPKHWEVISNTREIEKEDVDTLNRFWKFKKTGKISSYVFALIAGPFKVWESKSLSGISLRIFARKAIADYVNTQDWFEMTKKSFAFFEKQFDYAYPFEKYDQILVPEFGAGAMENVGAVTFNEDRFVRRGQPTPSDRFLTMVVLAHEMSHMWFGNLVTMKWWDDLWLNESFAEFMSFLATEANAKELDLLDPWVVFNADAKFSAYIEDAYKSTTHPIVGEVRNTDEALSSFDRITYEKGASALKQLYFYVGKDAFYKGLRKYFKDHAFSNTTRHDFLKALSEASGLDLKKWDEEWLRSKGTNQITVAVEYSQSKIKSLKIKQYPDPIQGLLRTHRTLVGLYKYDARGFLSLYKTVPITYQGSETIVEEAKGLIPADLIFPNTSDYDLANVVLDEKSLASTMNSLSLVEDTLLRHQLYISLWFMVRNRDISPQQYIDLAIKHTVNEKDLTILDDVIGNIRQKALLYIDKDQRQAYIDKVAQYIWERLQNAEAGSALQTLYFDHFVAGVSKKYESTLIAWLDETEKLPGFVLDADRRWNVVKALAFLSSPKIKTYISKEKQRDGSKRGLLRAKLAELAQPDLSVKKKWYKEFTSPGKLVATDARVLMGNFHDIRHEELTDFVADDFLISVLKQLRAKEYDVKVEHFASSMYPLTFKEEVEKKTLDFIQTNAELPVHIKKALLKRIEDSQRIRQVRNKFKK